MSTLPNSAREWQRRFDRPSLHVWLLAAVCVAAIVCVAYAIGRIE